MINSTKDSWNQCILYLREKRLSAELEILRKEHKLLTKSIRELRAIFEVKLDRVISSKNKKKKIKALQRKIETDIIEQTNRCNLIEEKERELKKKLSKIDVDGFAECDMLAFLERIESTKELIEIAKAEDENEVVLLINLFEKLNK